MIAKCSVLIFLAVFATVHGQGLVTAGIYQQNSPNPPTLLCLGALIDQKHVITHADCVFEKDEPKRDLKVSLEPTYDNIILPTGTDWVYFQKNPNNILAIGFVHFPNQENHQTLCLLGSADKPDLFKQFIWNVIPATPNDTETYEQELKPSGYTEDSCSILDDVITCKKADQYSYDARNRGGPLLDADNKLVGLYESSLAGPDYVLDVFISLNENLDWIVAHLNPTLPSP